MSIKTFGLAAAIAAGGVLVSPAMGDLTSLSYEIVGSDLVPDVGPNWTVRVYADMDAGNSLNACAGNAAQSKVISTSATFYQNEDGGPTSKDINSSFFKFVPSLEWDSYVTIGALYSDGTPFSSNELKRRRHRLGAIRGRRHAGCQQRHLGS